MLGMVLNELVPPASGPNSRVLTTAMHSLLSARSKAISEYTTPKLRTRGGLSAPVASCKSSARGSLMLGRSLTLLLT